MSSIQAEIIYNKNFDANNSFRFQIQASLQIQFGISTNQLVTSTTFKYVSSSPTVNLHKTMK